MWRSMEVSVICDFVETLDVGLFEKVWHIQTWLGVSPDQLRGAKMGSWIFIGSVGQ